jgi:hypothetical protein
MAVRTLRLSLVCVLALVTIAGCDNVRYVKVTNTAAVDRSATTVYFFIDECAEVNDPAVSESKTEIRVRVDLRVGGGGTTQSCIGGGVFQLAQPIGRRRVVDARTGKVVPVDFGSQYVRHSLNMPPTPAT